MAGGYAESVVGQGSWIDAAMQAYEPANILRTRGGSPDKCLTVVNITMEPVGLLELTAPQHKGSGWIGSLILGRRCTLRPCYYARWLYPSIFFLQAQRLRRGGLEISLNLGKRRI